jgi:hypothetical protein
MLSRGVAGGAAGPAPPSTAGDRPGAAGPGFRAPPAQYQKDIQYQ